METKSLLMWECGLKLVENHVVGFINVVTPYVGVWIETQLLQRDLHADWSLLMWECGLKPG